MALAMKRIMLVTRNVQFAIDVKRALEALGEYSVTAVADVRNAIEALREKPQRLVLLDTAGLSIAPSIMIEMIQARQEEIAILLAPDSDEARQLARDHQLPGVVDIPVLARDLIPALESAMRGARDALPDTQEAPAQELSEDTLNIETLVDDVLSEDLALNYTRRRLQASYELLHGRSAEEGGAIELLLEPDVDGDTVRYRLARAPGDLADTTAEVGGAFVDTVPSAARLASETTVGDLARAVQNDAGNAVEPSATTIAHAPAEIALEDSDAFEKMLSHLLDESTQLENLTLESLFDTTRELPGALGTGAVPAWLRETEKFIREPSFLPPALATPQPAQETTVRGLANSPAPAAATVKTAAERNAAMAIQDDAPDSAYGAPGASPLWRRDDDPLVAQMALAMTQMMTDTTAAATVLTRDDRIVAYAGALDLEEFRRLRRSVDDSWTASGEQSRIRFVKLPENGADYMLYSRATAAGLTLTMIFAAEARLSEIRRQGDIMRQALSQAPESEPPAETGEEAADQADSDARQPFAFVWLIKDPALLLRRSVARQLVFWLEVQLNSLNWRIRQLDVHQEFIYLHADVPGKASPDDLVRTVMDRARLIACAEDQNLPSELWADAYLVLQPGRGLSERELRHFLQFARA